MKRTALFALVAVALIVLAVGGWIVEGARWALSPRFRARYSGTA